MFCSVLGCEFSCTELVNSMDNLLSYCGLVDEKISASEKDLPVPWEIVEVWPSSVCVTIKPIWVIFQIWRTAELSVRQEHKISLEKIKNSPDNGKKLTDSVLDWKSEKYKDIFRKMLVSTTSPTATRKLHIESLFHDWIDVGCSNHWLQSKIYLQLKYRGFSAYIVFKTLEKQPCKQKTV